MAKYKLNLGPLPDQDAIPEAYEETEIRWDRIAMVAIALVLLIWLVVKLFSGGEQPEASPQTIEALPFPPVVESSEFAESHKPETMVLVPEPHSLAENADSSSVVLSALESTASLVEVAKAISSDEAILAESPSGSLSSEAKTSPLVPEDWQPGEAETVSSTQPIPLISPVSKLHVGITRADLTKTLINGEPVELYDYHVPMNEDGIIKVILFTEMEDLKGTLLFHDWYRNEVRQARVKIPVNVKLQRSYSSKFINAQMLGDWRVKVVDEAGELYAEANFVVQ